MHALSAWFARNPVAANLVMGLVLLAGALSVSEMRIESFPRIPPRRVVISVIYPGATAAQVDEGVTQRVEQALEGLLGVRRVVSSSTEEYAEVSVERTSSHDLQRLLEDIRTRVDAIVGWPVGAERPSITRDELSVFGLIVQVVGGGDEQTLQQAARLVEDELLAHPSIAELEIFGKRDHEVSIEVDHAVLEAHGLSLDVVRQAINAASLEYRAGALEGDDQRLLLRADRQAYRYLEFAEIPVLTPGHGVAIRLGDLAVIRDSFEDQLISARYNGVPSVGLIINTDRKSNLLRVREAVDEVLDRVRPQLPASVRLEVWADASEYIQDRLQLLRSNAWQGLLIIVVLLTLFLDLKVAFWVAMGVPISVAGALALMGDRFLGQSLNDITTFGMIVVLGILVDDAIVVGESIHEARQSSSSPVAGAIKGVNRVATATVFGAMTTIAAFAPLLLIDNDIARLFAGFSVVVIAAVAVSLVESKLILPAHLASIRRVGMPSRGRIGRGWSRLRRGVDAVMAAVVRSVYRPALRGAVRHRYAVLTLLLTLVVLASGLVLTGRIPTVFFPDVPGNTITVRLAMDQGSPESLTRKNAATLERAAEGANQALADEHALLSPPIAKVMAVLVDRHQVEVYGELTREAMDSVGTTEVLNVWRRLAGELEGAEQVEFTGSFETGGGFAIEVVGRDEAVLAEAVAALSARLSEIGGVHDVRSDLSGGQPEIRLRLRPEAWNLGLTLEALASQIGDGFGGFEVQRMQRGAEEVKVYLRYLEAHRQSLHHLLSSRLVLPDGRWVMLSEVAELERCSGASAIHRRQGRRAATIRATLDKEVIGAAEAFRLVERDVEQLSVLWPGVEARPAGELEEMGEIRSGMKKAFVLIAALIFALLAIPLRSYLKPVVIMSVVPFAIAGAILGHLALGLPLSILSFSGMLAAIGVVVNDSLVMVTRFNQLSEQGLSLVQAAIEAGCSRFRAIFLTTATTVSGLAPLIFETSEQARYLVPAAVSLACAELLATPVALVLVPIALLVLEDLKRMLARMLRLGRDEGSGA